MSPRRSKLLYVEGATDREVIYQLCNRHGIDNREHFEVRALDSYEQVRDALKQQTKPGGGLTRLGVVVDADESLADRWRSLADVLRGNGYAELDAPPLAEWLRDLFFTS